ncbi:UbiD family decarboxylase [Marinobacterium lutimaris]|uniref:2,5-furandicarboxylate decarboxylase 1 n=1 Tax=Marinobacterium lutimaris TaxID=568106 RepID=A0A1H6ALT8_9GAMM|nr:UbiD family decarboxylase [Marinobacterium lutimaris]SEG48726.1 2,5-furandicarboxylate decarboxylase 1 [Marinobacterium lutimaris]
MMAAYKWHDTSAGINKAERRDMDLRSWLTRLNETGRLAVAKPGAALRYGVAGLANRLDGDKALVAPAPEGCAEGTVISGLLSRREWMAEALGIEPDQLLSEFQRAAARPVACQTLEAGPCQEVVHEGEAVDLTRMLPIPTHNEHDSGAYISAGLMICRDPRTGLQNVSIHRLQVSGPRELGALLLPRHTLAYFTAAEEAGQDLEVAIVIGASPACLLASQAIVPIDVDELEIASALGGAPLDVVRCKTKELFVPAQCEIVIEGRLLANTMRPEGPFGEFPQYYGARADRHVVEVDCVTTRQRPLFHTIVGGGLEHLILGGIPREATILNTIQSMFPSVSNVHLAPGGTCRYHLYVQMKPRQRGEVKNVIMAAFAAHYDIKQVVVVDEDVDIYDAEMVEWAVATRFQADTDLLVVAGSQGSKLDPSNDEGLGAKMGLDATVPVDAPAFRFKRISVPGEQEIDLSMALDQSGNPGAWMYQ